MSSLLITALALVTPPADVGTTARACSSPAGTESQAVPSTPYELRRAVRAAMRNEALAKTQAQRADAIRELVNVFGGLRQDTQMAESDRIRLANTIRIRLQRIKKQLQQQMAREKRLATRKGGRSEDELDELVSLASRQRLAAMSVPLGLVSQSMGGPAALFAHAGGRGGGAGPHDHGQALVDLIQRTIQPDIWDVNGGPATIVYFAPLHALVVRAPSDVHHRAAGLLRGLRAAGR